MCIQLLGYLSCSRRKKCYFQTKMMSWCEWKTAIFFHGPKLSFHAVRDFWHSFKCFKRRAHKLRSPFWINFLFSNFSADYLFKKALFILRYKNITFNKRRNANLFQETKPLPVLFKCVWHPTDQIPLLVVFLLKKGICNL